MVAYSVLIWTGYSFLVFLVQLFWNLVPAWRWSEDTWVNFFLYYTLPLSLLVGVVTTVWFTIGSVRDLMRLFFVLKENYEKGVPSDDSDNGQILTK